MNHRHSGRNRLVNVVGRLGAASCLVLLTGCLSGLDGLAGRGAATPEIWLAEGEPADQQPATVENHRANPPEFSAEMAKARHLERQDKHGEAAAIYRRLIDEYPKQHEPHHRLGVVYDHQKRHRDAEKSYLAATGIERDDAELLNDLGYCLYLQGRLDLSRRVLHKAVKLAPKSRRFQNNLGLVCGHLGKYDEALAHFRRGGSEADAYYNLAMIRSSRDDLRGAKADFDRALKTDPTHEFARAALDALETDDVLENDATKNGEVLPASHRVPVAKQGDARAEAQSPADRARAILSRLEAERTK